MQRSLRLDRYLTHIGIGSRREVLKLINSGIVKVNGKKVLDPSLKIDPAQDTVEVEGYLKKSFQSNFYYKFYKPKGYITSTKDKEQTLFDCLPKDLPGLKRLFPAGRLDKDAEGLVILTTDGELAHRIMHPKWKLEKRYEVLIDKALAEEDIKRLEEGVDLSDGKTLPARITLLNEDKTLVEVAVREGRYHLIKRMFGKLGYRVMGLKRIAIGPITLGDLKPGEVRAISQDELEELRCLLRLKNS